MADKVKKIKVTKDKNAVIADIGADAKNIDFPDGKNLMEKVDEINRKQSALLYNTNYGISTNGYYNSSNMPFIELEPNKEIYYRPYDAYTPHLPEGVYIDISSILPSDFTSMAEGAQWGEFSFLASFNLNSFSKELKNNPCYVMVDNNFAYPIKMSILGISDAPDDTDIDDFKFNTLTMSYSTGEKYSGYNDNYRLVCFTLAEQKFLYTPVLSSDNAISVTSGENGYNQNAKKIEIIGLNKNVKKIVSDISEKLTESVKSINRHLTNIDGTISKVYTATCDNQPIVPVFTMDSSSTYSLTTLNFPVTFQTPPTVTFQLTPLDNNKNPIDSSKVVTDLVSVSITQLGTTTVSFGVFSANPGSVEVKYVQVAAVVTGHLV